jgi:hypothetical protein
MTRSVGLPTCRSFLWRLACSPMTRCRWRRRLSDPDLDSEPSNGVVSLNANGGFNYTPNTGFVGTDSFTYHATDGSANSAPATVTLNVGP